MKTRKYAIAIGFATALTLAVMAPSSFAQSTHLVAHVPFDFYVAGKLMPSGSYTVTPIPGSGIIKVDGWGNATFVMTVPVKGRDGDKNSIANANTLVFNRYGDLNFLSELHWEGFRDGRGVRESELELEARKTNAPIPVGITLSR